MLKPPPWAPDPQEASDNTLQIVAIKTKSRLFTKSPDKSFKHWWFDYQSFPKKSS